jgi:SCF-associated factor 1
MIRINSDTTNGRLGLASLPDLRGRESFGIPFPVQVRIPGRRIVSLVPGGWSFHALDSTGAVYVWGTLDATMSTLHSDGFAEPAKMAETPHRLVFPSSSNGSSNSSQGQGIGAIRSISCGRAHTLMLSSSGDILTFQSWGRPYTLASPLLKDHSDHEKGIKQIEAGWGFCAVLTYAGDIYVWWPGSDPLQAAYDTAVVSFEERIRQGETGLKIQADKSDSEKDGIPTIPCMPFELDVEPSHLAEIPIDLPELPQPPKDDVYGESVNLDMERTKIVKLAGGDNFLIALTNRGHVLKYDNLTNQAEYTRGRWEYVRHMCSYIITRGADPTLCSCLTSRRLPLCENMGRSKRKKAPKTTSSLRKLSILPM